MQAISGDPHVSGRGGGLHRAAILTATVFFASNMVAQKVATISIPALALAQIRILATAGFLGAAVTARWLVNRQTLRLPKGTSEWSLTFALATTGVAVNQMLFSLGLEKTSVIHAGLITATGPLMVALLAAALKIERITMKALVGAGVSFGGVALLLSESAGRGVPSRFSGDAFVIVSTLAFSMYTLQLKRGRIRSDSLSLVFLLFSVASVLMLPLGMMPALAVSWAGVSFGTLANLLFMVVCGSGLAYWLLGYALTGLQASTVANYSYLEPAIAVVLGALILDEHIALKSVAGTLLVIGGMTGTQCTGNNPLSVCTFFRKPLSALRDSGTLQIGASQSVAQRPPEEEVSCIASDQ